MNKPLFVYGILRKKSVLQQLLKMFDVKTCVVVPAKIQGYVCYYKNGINVLFEATEKHRRKNPDAEFTVHGSLLMFNGSEKNIEEMLDYINIIESGYHKTSVMAQETQGEEKMVEADVYVMGDWVKRKQILTFENVGMVLYPDSILSKAEVTENCIAEYPHNKVSLVDIMNSSDYTEPDDIHYTNKTGRMIPLQQIGYSKGIDYIG